jgi:hypothetical protein
VDVRAHVRLPSIYTERVLTLGIFYRSIYSSYLNIIQAELRLLGHTYTRIDGTMSADERIDAMEKFDSEGCDSMRTPRFILCSLHACGTGINLTRGNVVLMMDCWWNCAAEDQVSYSNIAFLLATCDIQSVPIESASLTHALPHQNVGYG